MSTLTNWIGPSRKQGEQYHRLATDAGIRRIVESVTKPVSGRTPDIQLLCRNHRSGFAIALRLTPDSIDVEARTNSNADSRNIRMLFLKAFPNSGSMEWTCAECGRKWDQSLVRLLAAGIDSVRDTPEQRGKQRFVIRMT